MTIMNLESGTMSLMSCFHEDNCDDGDEEEDVEEVYCKKKGKYMQHQYHFCPKISAMKETISIFTI